MRSLFVAVTLLALEGCQSAPPLDVASLSFAPAPAEPLTAATDWLGHVLKDPDSAKVSVVTISKAWCGPNFESRLVGNDIAPWHGWIAILSVNAKNSFGAYTGAEPYTALFDGNAVRQMSQGDLLSGDWADKIGACHQING